MAQVSARFLGQNALLSTELLAYYRDVSNSLLTMVDVETTGAIGQNARVIEVSVLQASLEHGIQLQRTAMINPKVRVPWNITRVTGITQDMVNQSGEEPQKVWLDLLPLLEAGVLTAHNLDFDYGFLQTEFKRLKTRFYRPPYQRLCTVILSRILLAELPSRSLPALVNHFQLDVGPSHRAEADTKACWLVAEYLLRQIQQEADEVLLDKFRQQWIRLQEAATILGCDKAIAHSRLAAAGCEARTSRRNQQTLYLRGQVEHLLESEKQLSLWQPDPET